MKEILLLGINMALVGIQNQMVVIIIVIGNLIKNLGKFFFIMDKTTNG